MLKKIIGFLFPLICCFVGTYYLYSHNIIIGILILAIAVTFIIIFPPTRIYLNPTSSKVNWLIGVIVLFYLYLSVTSLYEVPLIVDGDASHQAIVAGRAWSEKWPISGCCFKGEMTNAYLYFLGGWLKLVPGLFGLRLFSFIWGVLGSVVLYHLTKKILGTFKQTTNIPLYSALIYLTLPFAQYFFHSGLEITLVLFLVLLSLYFFIYTWETKKIWYLLVPSLLIGFGLYVGPQVKFWPVLVFLSWILITSYSKDKLNIKRLFKFWSITAVMLLLSALCYFPIISKFGLKQAIIGIRANQVSNLEVKQGENTVQYEKIQQILVGSGRSAVAFFYPVGLSGLFFIRSPYLNFVHAFLLILGWISVFFVNKRVTLYLTGWYVLGAIIAGGLTVGSPTSSRMVINLPVVAIFVACGIGYIERVGGLLGAKRQSIVKTILVLSVIIYGWQTTDNYFKGEYIDNSNQNDHISSTVGRYLADNDFTDKKIYMLSNSNYYYNAIMSLRLLSSRTGIDISEAEQPSLIKQLKETNDNLVIVPYWHQNFVDEIRKNIGNNATVVRINQPGGLPSSFIITN